MVKPVELIELDVAIKAFEVLQVVVTLGATLNLPEGKVTAAVRVVLLFPVIAIVPADTAQG